VGVEGVCVGSFALTNAVARNAATVVDARFDNAFALVSQFLAAVIQSREKTVTGFHGVVSPVPQVLRNEDLIRTAGFTA